MADEKAKAQTRTSLYTVDGDSIKRAGQFCPKCGPGVFMANHKDGRKACGKCGYMEK